MNAVRSVAGRPRQTVVGRTDLIGGGLIAASIVLGFAYMLIPVATIDERSEMTRKTEPPQPFKMARVPRARPDEPASTGSIGLLPVKSPRPTATDESSANSIEDDLRSRAFLIASSSAECDRVAGSAVLKGGGPGDLVVRLRCDNGAQFYLDREAIVGDGSARPEASASALTEPEALRTCEDKLRAGLAVPPSLMRVADSTRILALSSSQTSVTFQADAVDGFGAPVFLSVRCEIRGREIARMDVQPR
jgi:hypothetical protein